MTVQDEIIKEGNEKIAKFLGWYPETDTSLQITFEIYPAYTQTTLPFHIDWNFMMIVLDKIELMGGCILISNYNRDKGDKDFLAKHIGKGLTEDFFCNIWGSFKESEKDRYFEISNIGLEKLKNVWDTVIVFIDFYNDKTIKNYNYSDGKINRKELFK